MKPWVLGAALLIVFLVVVTFQKPISPGEAFRPVVKEALPAMPVQTGSASYVFVDNRTIAEKPVGGLNYVHTDD